MVPKLNRFMNASASSLSLNTFDFGMYILS
jgi:hypothetical protein